ncbi:Zinc finger protein 91 [Merluccius polli]|uniref:Zinc finger protein 91 n=1 Tax=Merluccius polli TaxID=89951 RepID=A0AA47N733_MERPO|nr:Zinc finger protein 91 [Merluccius polli]
MFQFPGDRLFCCQDCGEDFQEEEAYLDHLHQHSQENCLHVAKGDGQKNNSFVQSNDLNQNNSMTTKQHVYECAECGKSYGVIGHFLNHQRSHKQAPKSVFHELEQLKKKSFQCETCGRSYSRASALDAHRRCHEGNLIRSRNQAAADAFRNDDPVVESEHTETEANEPPENLFKCSCGKAFPASSRLKTHQRFSRNTQCTPELVKEVKDKPKKLFHCSECKKDFNRHIALVQHQRWHANSGEAAKKFPCEECGKVFMTLTFYYKHQRLVHCCETPAKSFLHQVCQLQKKGFECKDCGLKFSRASALQSHQLQHTDIFKDTEKEAQKPSTSLPQHFITEGKEEETNQLAAIEVDLTDHLDQGVDSTHHYDSDQDIDLQDSFRNSMTEVSYVIDSDEDAEGYETGDFNVEVISDSESEEEHSRDLNPDLELLCESDQEIKEELETEGEVSPTSLVLKPGIDLKIVQIDFEQMEQPSTPDVFDEDNKSALEKFDCPECPRWFSSASSLRAHKMWHGVHRKKRWTVGQHETNSRVKHHQHIQKHKDEKTYKSVPDQADGLEKKSFFCKDCGKWFSRMSSFISHQQNHPKRKPYPCPDCNLSYSHASGLYNHRKNCQAQIKEIDQASFSEKVFNPKKTLLGPKIYHCEQCGKGFWSLGAYSHHKQSPTLCLDLRPRKSPTSWKSVLGRPRSTRKVACPVCGSKFRHSGIMKSHMRKHEDGNHKCELCSKSFRLFSSLLRHQVVHTAHLIPPPSKSFQHQVEQFHMRSHGYDTGYSPSSPKSTVTIEALQCPTCLAHFNNKSSLRAHQKLCIKRDTQGLDNVIRPSENKLKCPSCSATFDSAVTFQDHIRDCRKISRNGDAEVKRKRVTEGESNTSKKEVGVGEHKLENYTASSKVKRSGTSDLKYKCKECERSFSVVGALNFHKRIHLQGHKSNAKTNLPPSVTHKKQDEQSKKPFYCSECGRRFSSNSALGTHKRWHTDKKFAGSLIKDDKTDIVSNRKVDEGPYNCTKCGKRFFYLCVLRRHQLYYPPCQTKAEPMYKGNSKKSAPEFSCPQCNRSFVRGSLLAAHYEHQHSKKHQHRKKSTELVQGKSQIVSAARIGKPLDATSSILKSKHQCPHCIMSFTKARGLRAHKWQAHSQSKKASISIKLSKDSISLSCKNGKKEDISVLKISHPLASKPKVARKRPSIGRRRKKGRSGLPPLKSIPCLDCGKRYSSAGALYNHKKVCFEFKTEIEEPKQEVQAPEPMAELPAALSRPSEYTVKCLFKCDKCGKSFSDRGALGSS